MLLLAFWEAFAWYSNSVLEDEPELIYKQLVLTPVPL